MSPDTEDLPRISRSQRVWNGALLAVAVASLLMVGLVRLRTVDTFSQARQQTLIAEDIAEQSAKGQVAFERLVAGQPGALREARQRLALADELARAAIEGRRVDGADVPAQDDAAAGSLLRQVLAALRDAEARTERVASTQPSRTDPAYVAANLDFREIERSLDRYQELLGELTDRDRDQLLLLGWVLLGLLVLMIVAVLVRTRQHGRELERANARLADKVIARTARLAASEAHVRAVVETALDAVVTMDETGTVQDWNPEAERIFGWPAAEAVGRPLPELVAPEGAPGQWAALADLGPSGAGTQLVGQRVELMARDRTGRVFPLELALARAGSEHEVRYSAFLRDVSAEVAAREEIERARDKAEAADHAKTAFLATMSHEIRTPMNAVIGMTSVLLDTDLDAEQREYVTIVRSSGEGLLTIINDILDYSKIEAGHLELEEIAFDLRDAIESALDLVTPQAAANRVELGYLLAVDSPTGLIGDPSRLRQVLVNLLSNAVKFTEDGEVLLEAVTMAVPDAPDRISVRIDVHDSGIGIPAERIPVLFDSFEQADASTTRRFGGTGLGLTIVKRLITAMGGTVGVRSAEGAGSTFTVAFDAPGTVLPDRAERATPAALAGLDVLVVDDTPANLRVLTQQIEGWEMRAHTTRDPHEALAWIRAGRRFDIAALDLHMPKLDGLALAGEIRRHVSSDEMPIVLLSSLGVLPREETQDVVERVLTKPVKPSVLRDTLGDLLNAGGVADAARHTVGANGSDLRILVAEDNAINQKVIALLLEHAGRRADIVANGREAVESVRRQPYDLVLMDVQMPEMDGLEATRRIRGALPADRQPCIVGVTAGAFAEDRQRCLEAGMDDHLAKPIEREELLRVLRSVERGRPDLPAPETQAEHPGEDAVDRAVLDALTGGMDDLAAELASTFVQDSDTLIARLRAAADRADLAEIGRIAHVLKSSSGSLGAGRLAESCSELERDARDGGLTDPVARVAEVTSEYARARAVFAAL